MFNLIFLNDSKLQQWLNEKQPLSINSNKLFIKSHICNYSTSYFVIYIIMLYKGRSVYMVWDNNTIYFKNVKYYLTPHFLSRFRERFNLDKVKKYTLEEMICKEILFIHNRIYTYIGKQYVQSRYGNIVIRQLNNKEIHCITYLRFGKYLKQTPNINWFNYELE